VVDKQCAFPELATVKARGRYFSPKIEKPGLKAFAPYNALFTDHWSASVWFSNPATDRKQPVIGAIKPLLGTRRIGQMPDQFAGQPVDLDALQLVQFLSLEVEDSFASHHTDVDTLAIEYIHDRPPIRGPMERLHLLSADSESNRLAIRAGADSFSREERNLCELRRL
jgi:hypothetical protein